MKVTLKIMGRISLTSMTFMMHAAIPGYCTQIVYMNRVEQVHNKCMKLRRNLTKSKKLVLAVAVG